MIYSYSPGLTWISICSLLSLTRVQGDGNDVNSPLGNSDGANVLYSNGSISVMNDFTVDRNVRELREIYLTREKKENEDPMNYLSKLYSDLEESRSDNAFSSLDDRNMESIVDPPQVDLQFHKKVPNCASEFNITKIIELVDDDKRQRKCPCSCGKSMDIYKGQAQVQQVALSNPPTQDTTAKIEPPKMNKLSIINPKKTDEKQKLKTVVGQQRAASSPVQRIATASRAGTVEPKKTNLPARPVLRPVNSNIQAKNVNMKPAQMGGKSLHKPPSSEMKQPKVGVPGRVQERGKLINSKQPFNSDWGLAEPSAHPSNLYQYKHPD